MRATAGSVLTCFTLEPFKRRGSAGMIIIIISRKTVKITSGFSILIRQHYAFIDILMRRNSVGHCPAQ